MKPIIGITAVYGENAIELKHAYSQAIIRAGGLPFVIPFSTQDVDIEQICQMIHGLLLTGGSDVSPLYYGEEPHAKLGRISPERDILEIAYAKTCLQLDIPILAICRGIQVLNVAAGGSLYQDIPSEYGGQQHAQNAPREYLAHRVQVEEGTLLHSVAGTADFRVNTFHHQAVRNIAPGFKIGARALDGIIEAIESETHRYVLGVQWHPEDTEPVDAVSAKLFASFVTMCEVGI